MSVLLDPREHAHQIDSGVPPTMVQRTFVPPSPLLCIPDAHVPRGPVSATRCFVILVLPTICPANVALHSLPDQNMLVEVLSADAGACCFVCCKCERTSSGWTQRGSGWGFVCCKWGRTSSGWTQRGSGWGFVCCKWGPLRSSDPVWWGWAFRAIGVWLFSSPLGGWASKIVPPFSGVIAHGCLKVLLLNHLANFFELILVSLIKVVVNALHQKGP